MRQALAEAIVDFLGFSRPAREKFDGIDGFSDRAWKRAVGWMNDAGIALYFLQKLKTTCSTDAVPRWLQARLERNLVANHGRVRYLSEQFDVLNRRFNAARVRYAVVKGFSLVPQFCPDSSLRHQSDFDYLVEGDSLAAARQVLTEARYVSKASCSSTEFKYLQPSQRDAPADDRQFEAEAPHAVELHTEIWDSAMFKVHLSSDLLNQERNIEHRWNGLVFPGLRDEDAFLLQVLHIWHHFFNYWVRISWLYEIGYFINRRAGDDVLWERVEERVGSSMVLREFIVIVTQLVARLFATPLPRVVHSWGLKVRPAPRIWLKHYAHQWVFSEIPGVQFRLFPRAKLVLFLQQQYVRNQHEQKQLSRSHLFSVRRLKRIALAIKDNPVVLVDLHWWKQQYLVRRLVFHVLATVRYALEIPRWRGFIRKTEIELHRASTEPTTGLEHDVSSRGLSAASQLSSGNRGPAPLS